MAAPAGSDNRRALVFAGAGLGLVVLLLVGSKLFGGGGGDGGGDQTLPTLPPGGLSTTTTAPVSGEAPPEAAAEPAAPIPDVPDSFEIAELRDPFESPLSSLVGPVSGGSTGGSTGGGTGGGSTGGGEGGGTAPDSRATIRLVDVFEDSDMIVRANVEVNGTVQEVGVGDTFGPSDRFEVLSLDDDADCGEFLRGDVRFRMCVGDERTK